MRAHLHRFLLILLMLALPLQAFASASMPGCLFQQPAAGAMADVMMDGCHEPVQPESSPAQHDCKHCAACALGSVLPAPVNDSVGIMPLRHGLIPSSASAFIGFIPEGPERPPRSVLA
ncbi:MAG: hypothetical protein Q7U80_08230 [Thiobacillus sp.]|nr:hypothetical protein [Thiobacillus sp.]